MERVIDLAQMLRLEIMDYCTPALKAKAFFLENTSEETFSVVSIADYEYPRSEHNGIVVLARVENDTIVVEEDTTDRPLWEELVRAGIPREKIVLVYAGEKLPAKNET